MADGPFFAPFQSQYLHLEVRAGARERAGRCVLCKDFWRRVFVCVLWCKAEQTQRALLAAMETNSHGCSQSVLRSVQSRCALQPSLHSSMSIRVHNTALKLTIRFCLHLLLGNFRKGCPAISIGIYIRQLWLKFYLKTCIPLHVYLNRNVQNLYLRENFANRRSRAGVSKPRPTKSC
jgi:hypothetical protein